MLDVKELSESTSDTLKKIADEQYVFTILEESLQRVIIDTETNMLYYCSEDVQYYKEYIWRYDNSIVTWERYYPKPQ